MTESPLALVPDPPTLDEALDTFAPEIDDAARREGFVIDSEQKAHWAARKLRGIQEQIDGTHATAEAEVARINEWRWSVVNPLIADAQFFESLLEGYHRSKIEAEDADNWSKVSNKTVTLPGVKLAARKPADTWEFNDELFIPWAQENLPEAVRVPEPVPPSVDKNMAKQLLTVTPAKVIVAPSGEEVPGVTVTEAKPTFAVKVEG